MWLLNWLLTPLSQWVDIPEIRNRLLSGRKHFRHVTKVFNKINDHQSRINSMHIGLLAGTLTTSSLQFHTTGIHYFAWSQIY